MKELEFINEGKRIVRNFQIDQKLKEECGRDWVFQIADGFIAVLKTDAKHAVVLYDPRANRFYVKGE